MAEHKGGWQREAMNEFVLEITAKVPVDFF